MMNDDKYRLYALIAYLTAMTIIMCVAFIFR